jgi:hypothetical protein
VVAVSLVKQLTERSRGEPTRAAEGLYELRFGDENDSARVLRPEVFAPLDLRGDPVVATPKQDLLLVCGADDVGGLRALLDRLVALEEDGAQNVRLVRLHEGRITPLQLEASHPLRSRLADLQRSADQRDAELQQEALAARLGDSDDVPFVASVKRMGNARTGEELSFVVHTEDTPTLLPRADFVVFRRVDLEKKTATTLACAPWATALALMRGRWKTTPLYPTRWLATELPTQQELQQLGCRQPQLAIDLGVARRYE